MGFYEPKEGERVRVVLEGKAFAVDRIGGSFTVGFNRVKAGGEHVVSIEKVEPPVVTFKPGDTVRTKLHSRQLYSLGEEGWYSHQTFEFHDYGLVRLKDFTSQRYELVELK